MYWQDQRYTPHTVSVSACHMYIRSRPLSQVVLGVDWKTGNARFAICLFGGCLFVFGGSGAWSKNKQDRGLLNLKKYHREGVFYHSDIRAFITLCIEQVSSLCFFISSVQRHSKVFLSTLRSLLNKLASLKIVTIVKRASWFDRDLRVHTQEFLIQ